MKGDAVRGSLYCLLDADLHTPAAYLVPVAFLLLRQAINETHLVTRESNT